MGNVQQGRSITSTYTDTEYSDTSLHLPNNNPVIPNQQDSLYFKSTLSAVPDILNRNNYCDMIGRLEHQAILQEKDRKIDQLTAELSKITAVLNQHITECEIWKRNPPMTISQKLENLNTDSIGCRTNSPLDKQPGLTDEAACPHTQNKRLGVSGEPSLHQKTRSEIKYYDKDSKSRQEIRNALRRNELLKNLDAIQLQEIVSCMYEYRIEEGCYIIRQGEVGHHLYVAAEGEYEVWDNSKYLYTMGPGSCFGEIALLYNCKRTASIKAVRAARLWVLEQKNFQAIMMTTGLKKMQERVTFLCSVPLLRNLEESQLQRISDVLESQIHPDGECILRQGEEADSFFIIKSGEVRVTIKMAGGDENNNEIDIRRMRKGEYFGEKALLGEGRRTANIYSASPEGVELLCLYRKDFLELIGNIENIENKDYIDAGNLHSQKNRLPEDKAISSRTGRNQQTRIEVPNLRYRISLDQILGQTKEVSPTAASKLQRLEDLRYRKVADKTTIPGLRTVAVIGKGGFGYVELVHPINDSGTSFALKRMKKVHIVETKQQDHVHSEKKILMAVDSPFICKLYKTFRDNKFVYMLMEFCPGGELWTFLRDKRSFDDKLTLFSLACVINALEYLHSRCIIYRDLKPENLLLTMNGYIKLCDFGFATRLEAGGKTWTFCGTPEYVPPEVILNKGHDYAADYWALGILTCELLMGTPPFQAAEPIKIYIKTLRGIESCDLSHHKNINARAYQFIKRLCRNNPSERLGMGRNGIHDIRAQKYFQGFDWDGILSQNYPSPFHPKISGPLDVSNFDKFPMVNDIPPDENSGWDVDF